MVAVMLRGELPEWAASTGSGYGYGSGDGSGSGDGDGSGYGYGDGDGYGYGSGDGSGSGYGYGYGSGSGYGYGDGYGYGYGSGDGSGSGSGYGYGSGDGYGDGDGSGDGDGDGDAQYWSLTVQYFAKKWSENQQARLGELKTAGAKICFWRSTPNGDSANGGRLAVKAAPGVVHEVAGPLEICSNRALHASLLPPKWQGERWWIVALIGEVVGDDEKYAALKREIVGECL